METFEQSICARSLSCLPLLSAGNFSLWGMYPKPPTLLSNIDGLSSLSSILTHGTFVSAFN